MIIITISRLDSHICTRLSFRARCSGTPTARSRKLGDIIGIVNREPLGFSFDLTTLAITCRTQTQEIMSAPRSTRPFLSLLAILCSLSWSATWTPRSIQRTGSSCAFSTPHTPAASPRSSRSKAIWEKGAHRFAMLLASHPAGCPVSYPGRTVHPTRIHQTRRASGESCPSYWA